VAKRRQGGQPKNTNARKHGFYAGAVTSYGRNVLRRAALLDPGELVEEIALLRSRIHILLKADPENLQVLLLGLRQLTKMVAVNYGLTHEQQQEIHSSLRQLILDLAPEGMAA
jgi:ribosomal protein L34